MLELGVLEKSLCEVWVYTRVVKLQALTAPVLHVSHISLPQHS